jgi:transcription elongation GreA/GreB family factor
MTIKQQIYNYYLEHLNDRIQNYREMISDLAEDAQNDAKGSAGDKHETALSMMHIEQEKLNYKLKEVLDQKQILESIDVDKVNKKIGIGSLIQTNTFLFFMSTALPKNTIEEIDVVALSPSSPLGKIMLGKETNEEFEFNEMKYKILSIE